MKRKITAILMIMFMVFGLLSANINEVSAADAGDFTITATNSGDVITEKTDYKFSSNKLTINTTTPVTISMKAGVTSTANIIEVDTDDGDADITLNGINIDTTKTAPVKVTGSNDLTLRLVGENNVTTTYGTSAYCFRIENTGELLITSSSQGTLTASNPGSHGTIYSKQNSSFTIGGSAKLTLENTRSSGYPCIEYLGSGMFAMKDNAQLKAEAVKDEVVLVKGADSGVEISGSAKVEITKGGDGILLQGSQPMTIKDNADIDITVTGSCLESSKSAVTITGNADFTANNARNGVFRDDGDDGVGVITVNGNAKVTCNNLTSWGLYSEVGALALNGNARYVYTSTDSGSNAIFAKGITISDNVYVDVECGDGRGIQSSSYMTIEGKADVSVSNQKYQGIQAIDNLTIKGDANVDIVSAGSYASLYSAKKLNIEGSATVTVEGERYGISADGSGTGENPFTVKDDAKVEVTITTSSESGDGISSYSDLEFSGNANVKVTVTGSDVECVYLKGKLILSDKAKVAMTGGICEIGDGYQVTPPSDYAYEVRYGTDAASLTTNTYYETATGTTTEDNVYFYAEAKPVYAVPTVSIDYQNETLTGFAGEHKINDSDVTVVDGEVKIDESWFGTTITIIRKGDATYAASLPQSLEISARPEAPVVSGDYAVSTTEDGKFVYTIETVENAEYKMDDGQWQDSNVFDNIEPLSNHMFYVRVKATNNSFAGTEGKSAIIFEKLTGSASVSMEDWISNETASEPNPVSETNGTDNVTYFYKLSSADDSDYSSVRPTKPGTYTIKAVFGETATYGEVVVTSEFTINEADEKQDVTDKNKKVEDEEKQVDTGDATNMLMWYVLVFLSGSAFALAFVFRKRKA